MCRFNNLHIRDTLFIADNFSYIFDNIFNKYDVVFFMLMLNVTFLDTVNEINFRVNQSFHCSVVMVSDFTLDKSS